MNRAIAIPNLKEIIALEGDPELKRQLQDQLGDLLAQKREANFGWVSVEDELPEEEVGVLVLDQTKTQSQARHVAAPTLPMFLVSCSWIRKRQR